MKRCALLLYLGFALLWGGPWTVPAGGEPQVFDPPPSADCFTAYFLDLGLSVAGSPGDCTVIISPGGEHVMMVDAGLESSRDEIMNALNAMGISRIDCLVVSHPHGDHTGCMPEIMDTFEIGACYTSAVKDEAAQNYQDYMAAMKRRGIPHVIVGDGDTIPFGPVAVDVLWPAREIVYPGPMADNTAFINNHSLVLKFTYGESTLLLGGDLYLAGEQLVINRHKEALDVDVIKLNHHGKNTSSGATWRRAVSAEAVVCQADTLYDYALLKRFLRESEVFHTMLDGNICIRMYADGTRQTLCDKREESPFLLR